VSRGLMERLYASPFGRAMSFAANNVARMQKPFMVYGYYDPTSSQWHRCTRMSSTVTIMNRPGLKVANDVWVWQYAIWRYPAWGHWIGESDRPCSDCYQ